MARAIVTETEMAALLKRQQQLQQQQQQKAGGAAGAAGQQATLQMTGGANQTGMTTAQLFAQAGFQVSFIKC